MIPIQIRILTGSQAGRQMMFAQSPITFGRNANNVLAFDLPFVSRQHGELRFEDNRWQVINHSDNPMKLDRKVVKKKPRTASATGTVSIGGQAMFSFEQQPVSHAPETSSAPAQTDASQVTGRQKLWIGIGLYLLVMIGLVIFFSTLAGTSEEDSLASLTTFSSQQIADEMAQPLAPRAPDPRRVQGALDEVATMLALEDTEPDALFRAHQAYKQALAYTPEKLLEQPFHVRNHYMVQRRLTDHISHLYERAHSLLRQRQFNNASDAYRKLLDAYPAGNESPLVKVAQQQWAVARREAARRK